MHETLLDVVAMPFAFDALSERFLNVNLLPKSKLVDKYKSCIKNRVDAKTRYSYADFVFRTQLPYVQSGVVVEEVTEQDLQGVRGSIQRWKMACKKIARNAWAYTQSNYPNMLLYAVGVVTASYSLYKLVYQPDCDRPLS